jgi:4-diphosphocytidyl-2-C-methyl-D-erythritol kinase
LVLDTPAKVNLHLEIRGLQPDGYHEILSIVQSVPLFDRIRIRSLKEKGALELRCDPPIGDGGNIARSAAEAFRDACGLEAGLEIRIEKRIPLGAGLGGGSSDAAAVLRGLNRLFSLPLSLDRLSGLAAGLGSDVPFFLRGSAALMSGRGERIEVLEPRTDLYLVLVYPGFPVSTAEAYRWFDQDRDRPGSAISPGQLRLRFEGRSPDSWGFFNSFQSTIERRYPVIGKIRGELERAGAGLATLSGRGSSVVGVFSEYSAARSAHHRVRTSGAASWLLVPLQSAGSAD